MKKLVACMAIAISFLFAQNIFAQSITSNLRRYCIIDPTAEFILDKCNFALFSPIEMAEYNGDRDGQTFTVEMAINDQWGHASVALNEVANDVWLLVSKQLHGETGQLTLTKLNFIPTKNTKHQSVLAIVMWNEQRRKWVLMSVPLSGVKTIYKGARMFSLKS